MPADTPRVTRALVEYASQMQCVECGGGGMLTEDGVPVRTCDICDGTGVESAIRALCALASACLDAEESGELGAAHDAGCYECCGEAATEHHDAIRGIRSLLGGTEEA